MRVLVIDDSAKAEIKRVRDFALARRQSLHHVMARMRGDATPPGDDKAYSLELKDGWRVVYTIEEHPSGWYHHISISVDPREEGKDWPHPGGVEVILKEFEIGPLVDRTHAWQEDTGHRKAVNLLFRFKE